MKDKHNRLNNVYIDTTTDKRMIVQVAGIKLQKILVRQQQASRSLLPLIQQAMKQAKVMFNDVEGIAVVAGPGPFTALRVGVVTANTLALVLAVPVVGLHTNQFASFENFVSKANKKLNKSAPGLPVQPYYGRPPNITKTKKKRITR